MLRAGAWLEVAGISGVAVVVGGCGAAFPAAAIALLPICFALLAAAAAFTLDEPASLVVDVTPTGPARRTAIRAVALLAPLTAGALVMLVAALRGQALYWAAAVLALAGNVLLGFAVACVARIRTGEPGAAAGTAVVLVLMAPGLVPQVERWVRTFPEPGGAGPSSDPVWWTFLAVCVAAIAVSTTAERLTRATSRLGVRPDRPVNSASSCRNRWSAGPVGRTWCADRRGDQGGSAAAASGRPPAFLRRVLCPGWPGPDGRSADPPRVRASGLTTRSKRSSLTPLARAACLRVRSCSMA